MKENSEYRVGPIYLSLDIQDWPTRDEAYGGGQISYEGVARIVLTHRINKQERRSK